MKTLPNFQRNIGKIVLFRVNETEVRPALIVRQWNENCANILIFPDGNNDGYKSFNPEGVNPIPGIDLTGSFGGVWKTSVGKGEGVGQWLPMDEVQFEDAPDYTCNAECHNPATQCDQK